MKKTSKIISFLLALLLLSVMIPLSASAATSLTDVKIRNVQWPYAGEVANPEYSLPGSAQYIKDYGAWFESEAPITEATDLFSRTPMEPTDVFKYEKYYIFAAIVKTENKEELIFADTLDATVNYDTAMFDVNEEDPSIVVVWYNFPKLVESVFKFDVTPKSFDFGTVEEGYTSPASKEFVISNTGNEYLYILVNFNNQNFVITKEEDYPLEAENNGKFKIQPKSGLKAGTYTAEAVVEPIDSLLGPQKVTVKFTVKAPAPVSSEPEPVSSEPTESEPTVSEPTPAPTDTEPEGDGCCWWWIIILILILVAITVGIIFSRRSRKE